MIIPNEQQQKFLDWFFTKDLTPDLLFNNPMENIQSPQELQEWPDKPESEKVGDVLGTSGGALEQLIIPQTPWEYPLFAAAPFIKLMEGAAGIKRAGGAMQEAWPNLQSHEFIDDIAGHVDEAVDPLAQTYKRQRFTREGFAPRVVEEQTPILRRLIKEKSDEIRKLLSGPQVLEQSATRPAPTTRTHRIVKKGYVNEKSPYEDKYSWEAAEDQVSEFKDIAGEKTMSSSYAQDASPRTAYEIQYDKGGVLDPETNLYLARSQETGGGKKLRGYSPTDLGERTTARVMGDTERVPWQPYQAEELHRAVEARASMIDDGGTAWLPGAKQADHGGEVLPHSLHPEDSVTPKDVKFTKALEKEYQKSLIDDMPSQSVESQSGPRLAKERVKELRAAEKEFTDAWGVDFTEELPYTRKLLNAELEQATYLSKKTNKPQDFVSDMFITKVKNMPGQSYTKQAAVEIQPHWDYLWTQVRSLRERSRLADSLGDTLSAARLNRKADDVRVLARQVEIDKGWKDEVIEAMAQAEGAKRGTGHVLDDLGTAEQSPFRDQQYAKITEKNKAVPQSNKHLTRQIPTDEVTEFSSPMGEPRNPAYPTSKANQKYWFNEADKPYSRVQLKEGGDYVLPRTKQSATQPMKHVPTPEEKLAMVHERATTKLQSEIKAVEEMMDRFGGVPERMRGQMLKEMIQRLRGIEALKNPVVRMKR